MASREEGAVSGKRGPRPIPADIKERHAAELLELKELHKAEIAMWRLTTRPGFDPAKARISLARAEVRAARLRRALAAIDDAGVERADADEDTTITYDRCGEEIDASHDEANDLDRRAAILLDHAQDCTRRRSRVG